MLNLITDIIRHALDINSAFLLSTHRAPCVVLLSLVALSAGWPTMAEQLKLVAAAPTG